MIIATLAWLLLAIIALPFCVLIAELAAGLARRAPADRAAMASDHPQTVILMPAHDEAKGLGAIIGALSGELDERTRLLVVADNCTDGTADVARAAGAWVVERNDPAVRGKGHALAFGRDRLCESPPDCVVVLDADCTVEPGTIDRLVRSAMHWHVPVQGRYLLRTAGTSPLVQLSNFAFLIKNLVRQRGATRLGAAAVLGGTGMAFAWPLFRDAPLATSDLVEDLALGVHFTELGRPPRFVDDAVIWSEAASDRDTLAQRTRWEHGFIATARRQALPLVKRGLQSRRYSLIGLGLHLIVPPLALLVALGIGALGVLAILAFSGGPALPALLSAALLGLTGALLLGAWFREARDILPLRALLLIPLYLLWKLPVYARLLTGRQTAWVRTGRGD